MFLNVFFSMLDNEIISEWFVIDYVVYIYVCIIFVCDKLEVVFDMFIRNGYGGKVFVLGLYRK